MTTSSNAELIAFEKKFRQNELHVTDIGPWALSVRPGQITLGAMVLACRSGAEGMSDLTADEASGLGAAMAVAECLLKQVFGAQRINYLCLMMQDPIVHFHVLPRYAETISRHGVDWVDRDWPGAPKMVAAPTEDAVLLKIRDVLRAAV